MNPRREDGGNLILPVFPAISTVEEGNSGRLKDPSSPRLNLVAL